MGKLTDKVVENLKSSTDLQRGLATLAAYGRGGLKDLQNALYAFPESQKENAELGMIASPTPQMVTAELTGAEVEPERVQGRGR